MLNKNEVVWTVVGAVFVLCGAVPQVTFAAVIASTDSFRVHGASEYVSTVDASAYSNLRLSFTYDATQLDFGPPQDSFSYGYRSGATEVVLGTVLGLAGSTTDEWGSISAMLPAEAEVAALTVFVRVSANSATPSDKVELRNIKLEGEEKSVPVIDVCANLEGTQEAVPDGYQSLSEGQCTEVVPDLVDVCLNLDGTQTTVPTGYVAGTDSQCIVVIPDPEPVDVCTNLTGLQEVIPTGYDMVDGFCTVKPEPVVDVCTNLEGIQATVPTGMTRSDAGVCTAPVVEDDGPRTPPKGGGGKPIKQCPRGFAKWIDRFPGGYSWRADDVYQAVILVGGPVSRHLNRDRARELYISGPTEIGDRYYRRFHRIELVCVR